MRNPQVANDQGCYENTMLFMRHDQSLVDNGMKSEDGYLESTGNF